MRRLLLGLAISGMLVFSQEHAPAAEGHAVAAAEHSDHDAMLPWKWANFALLVLGLGYLANKMLPPFFAGRTAEIQKGLADAAAMQKESEAKVAAIEGRLKDLEGEIASIRSNAASEMVIEEGRVRKEGDDAIAKMRRHTGLEIATATKAAQAELRRYAALVALETAEGQLRARINAPVDAGLIGGFLKGSDN